MTLPCKVEQYMDRHRMLDGCDTVVAAVSGGADSTAMLRMLKTCARGAGVRLSARISTIPPGRRLRCGRGLCPRTVFAVSNSVFQREAGCARARRQPGIVGAGGPVRLFTANGRGFSCRADRHGAHHERQRRNRAVPYVARRGRAGHAGHRPVRGAVIRPLLCLQRAEIEQYLREAGQSYRTDASNADLAYSRNRIRHAVVPELCRINPRALEHISRMCELLAADAAVLDRLADDVYREAEKGTPCWCPHSKPSPAHPLSRPQTVSFGTNGHNIRSGAYAYSGRAFTVGTNRQPHPTERRYIRRTALRRALCLDKSCACGPIGTGFGAARRIVPRRRVAHIAAAGRSSARRSPQRARLCETFRPAHDPLHAQRRPVLHPRRGLQARAPSVHRPQAASAGARHKSSADCGERVAWIMGVGPSADCRPDNTTKQYLNIYIKEISNEG